MLLGIICLSGGNKVELIDNLFIGTHGPLHSPQILNLGPNSKITHPRRKMGSQIAVFTGRGLA